MPIKDKEKRQKYINEYKKKKRKERGLQKQGRPVLTEEQKLLSKEHRKEWERKWSKLYRDVAVKKRLLWSAKARAKKKNIHFSITEKDIVIPEKCPYLDIPLLSSSRRGEDRSSVCSLDRIDPSLGYICGNIEVISHLANTMKSSATREQLLLFATKVFTKFK